jgi:predicted NUDIX family NTP pyrophosphohydrolase
MVVRSAGLLPYVVDDAAVAVFLVHPGGPFFAGRDDGAWSLAKGLYPPTEEPFAAACREFEEEVGVPAPLGPVTDLGEVVQTNGKRIRGYAVQATRDLRFVASNTFELEWPRGSGIVREYPEVDGGAWWDLVTARRKLSVTQATFIDRLVERLDIVT